MREVTTWLRVDDDGVTALEAALATAGLATGDTGPLVAILDAPVEPGDVADVLASWIGVARAAMVRDADVVTLLSDDHLEGDDVGRLSVGHGLISATRAYGFEGQRAGRRANVVVGPPEDAMEVVAFLLGSGSLSGQVLLAGDPHHGRQRP